MMQRNISINYVLEKIDFIPDETVLEAVSIGLGLVSPLCNISIMALQQCHADYLYKSLTAECFYKMSTRKMWWQNYITHSRLT